eukprot:6477567-Alexandrium_andersonii.AAC.1
MPHGRAPARLEGLAASPVALPQRDDGPPAQDTAPQHGRRGRQSAQDMIKRDDLGLRIAARHS